MYMCGYSLFFAGEGILAFTALGNKFSWHCLQISIVQGWERWWQCITRESLGSMLFHSILDLNKLVIESRDAPLDIDEIKLSIDLENLETLDCDAFATHSTCHLLALEHLTRP